MERGAGEGALVHWPGRLARFNKRIAELYDYAKARESVGKRRARPG